MNAPGSAGSDANETARTEAFSDGVFAIAITLLVLELKVPPPSAPGGLGAALRHQWPSYFAFLTSFATIGIMWLNHHMIFNLIRRVDRKIQVLNLMLLLGVTVTPFPTALVASCLAGDGQKLAAGLYASTFLYIAVAFNLLWRYASWTRHHPSLLRVPADDPAVLAVHAQYRYGPLYYLAALILSVINAPASVALNLAFAGFFLLPPRRAG